MDRKGYRYFDALVFVLCGIIEAKHCRFLLPPAFEHECSRTAKADLGEEVDREGDVINFFQQIIQNSAFAFVVVAKCRINSLEYVLSGRRRYGRDRLGKYPFNPWRRDGGAHGENERSRRSAGNLLKEVPCRAVVPFCLPDGLEVVEQQRRGGCAFQQYVQGGGGILSSGWRMPNDLQNSRSERSGGGEGVTSDEKQSIAVSSNDGFVVDQVKRYRGFAHSTSTENSDSGSLIACHGLHEIRQEAFSTAEDFRSQRLRGRRAITVGCGRRLRNVIGFDVKSVILELSSEEIPRTYRLVDVVVTVDVMSAHHCDFAARCPDSIKR